MKFKLVHILQLCPIRMDRVNSNAVSTTPVVGTSNGSMAATGNIFHGNCQYP